MKSNIIVWIAIGLSIIALAISIFSFFGSNIATQAGQSGGGSGDPQKEVGIVRPPEQNPI